MEALQNMVGPRSGLYDLAGVLDSVVTQNGNKISLIIDSEGNLRKVTELKNGIRVETELGAAPRRYVCSEERGQIFQVPRFSKKDEPILNAFENIPGLEGVRYSEGSLGRPIDPSYDFMLTPKESEYIRDYIYGKHDDFEGVKKIWESKK